MRQVIISRAGPPDVLRVRDVPTPNPQPGEVRIKVEAIGVNFADIMGRLGVYPDAPPLPYVPGYEVAGTVDALGKGVEAPPLGSAVMALVHFGGYSEWVCVPAAQVFPRPAGASVEQAAGFLVTSLTAYVALVGMAGIKPGEHVLIHAAAGGVGLAAVDICRIFDATIYGTASAGKHEFLRARGVRFPMDYHRLDFEREIKRLTDGYGVQIALDSIGGRSWLKSYRALSAGGRLVLFGVSALAPSLRRSWWAALRLVLSTPWLQFNPIALTSANKGVLGVNLEHFLRDRQATARERTSRLLQEGVNRLLTWYEEGRLNVHVDRVFPLDQAAEAHRYIQARRNIGKVILVP